MTLNVELAGITFRVVATADGQSDSRNSIQLPFRNEFNYLRENAWSAQQQSTVNK